MAEIRIIKTPIRLEELREVAAERFGDMVKAVVDVENGVMAIGGELHVDMEVILMEQEGSLRPNTWGINLYPDKVGEEFLEFDSMINLKPSYGNRTRGVEDREIQDSIKEIVERLII